jgi:hypothetical protein
LKVCSSMTPQHSSLRWSGRFRKKASHDTHSCSKHDGVT